MTSGRNRWISLLVVYFCMLVYALTLQSLPPVLTLIIGDLKISHTQAGLLMSLFTLPAIFLAIIIGLLSDRWGSFKVGLISFILVIAGTVLFALSPTFLLAGMGRAVAGAGAAAISIVAAKILSMRFKGREMGTAMGIYNTAMPVGTIICFTTFGKWGESTSWRSPVIFSAIIGIIGLVLFLLLNKPTPGTSLAADGNQEKKPGTVSSLISVGRLIWLAGLCWLWFNAAAISFSTFAPDFFVSKGLSIPYAGLLTSLLMWGSLALSPIIGHLIDRYNNNHIFIIMGGSILSISLYFVSKATNFIFPMLIMAVAAALVPTPVFSYFSKVLPRKSLGLGFGFLNTVSGLGMFFGPYLSGLIRDKTGSYQLTFVFLSVLSLLIPISAVLLGIKQKKMGT